MANGNQKQVNGTENQGTVEQQNAQNVQAQQQAEQPVAAPQQQVPTQQEKEGFGGWLKKHWKGVAATIVGAGTAVGSAVVAYRKGKQAGVMSVPVPDQEDYSLDPNRE